MEIFMGVILTNQEKIKQVLFSRIGSTTTIPKFGVRVKIQALAGVAGLFQGIFTLTPNSLPR